MKTREELIHYCDGLLAEARQYASENHALITFPGEEGGYGRRVDGLEGFARTFLLAGFRLVGARGDDSLGLAQWYAEGIAAGTDPQSPERWITLPEHGQAKVEAASLALILDMTREWIWDTLPAEVQANVVAYLAPAVGDQTYPRNNWIWFRLVVQTFLRSVGGPYSESDIRADLATHQSYIREGGWYADGPMRAYDNYVGWAMHLYPALWARMAGASDLAGDYPALWDELLDRYLQDAMRLVGGDGAPLIEGRSLIYRFASAAPLWVGALVGVPSVPLGQLREAALGIVTHFQQAGVGSLLTMGWHHEWRKLAQSYSGPSSPYWASKGLLGVALPEDHPVWAAPAAELPTASEDQLFTISSPGWVVSSTQDDGIVRVINHGTDHACEGAEVADSPLYARLGYSTATAPLMGENDWISPIDQSVTLLDENGLSTHRAGMRLDYLKVDGNVGIASSTGRARWLEPHSKQKGHGSGYEGKLTKAGDITIVSFVRGPWEIRAAKVVNVSRSVAQLRFGGWPVASNGAISHSHDTHSAHAATVLVRSGIAMVREGEELCATGVHEGKENSPLGEHSWTPWLAMDVHEGSWHTVALELVGTTTTADELAATAEFVEIGNDLHSTITWPDGLTTKHVIPLQSL